MQFHFDVKSPGTCGPNTEGGGPNKVKLLLVLLKVFP